MPRGFLARSKNGRYRQKALNACRSLVLDPHTFDPYRVGWKRRQKPRVVYTQSPKTPGLELHFRNSALVVKTVANRGFWTFGPKRGRDTGVGIVRREKGAPQPGMAPLAPKGRQRRPFSRFARKSRGTAWSLRDQATALPFLGLPKRDLFGPFLGPKKGADRRPMPSLDPFFDQKPLISDFSL